MKLLGVLVQTALESQLSELVAHSSISEIQTAINLCRLHKNEFTYTSKSISSVALVTGTSEATRGVGTESIYVTVISICGTLINICKEVN